MMVFCDWIFPERQSPLHFTEARGSEWQWHQLGHMQVCTSLQTDNHASTPPLSFLQARCLSCHPTSSIKALMSHTSGHLVIIPIAVASGFIALSAPVVVTYQHNSDSASCSIHYMLQRFNSRPPVKKQQWVTWYFNQFVVQSPAFEELILLVPAIKHLHGFVCWNVFWFV